MIGRLRHRMSFRILVDWAVHFFSECTVKVYFVAEACGFVEVSSFFLGLGVIVRLGMIDFQELCSISTVVREGSSS